MARQPEMITGFRGPRDEARTPAPVSPDRTIPAGKRVFQFIANRYRLQLTAPRAMVLPDGRIQPGERPLVVVAEEGFKTLDVVKDKKAIKLLEEHPDFGRDFWDYADVLAGLKKARTDQAISVLADPEARAAIVEALRNLGEESFKLPSKDTKQSEASVV